MIPLKTAAASIPSFAAMVSLCLVGPLGQFWAVLADGLVFTRICHYGPMARTNGRKWGRPQECFNFKPDKIMIAISWLRSPLQRAEAGSRRRAPGGEAHVEKVMSTRAEKRTMGRDSKEKRDVTGAAQWKWQAERLLTLRLDEV